VARIDAADPGARLAEDRGVGGDRQVAQDVQHVPSADREAVHHGDHRLRDLPDGAVQGLDVHGTRAVLGVAAASALLPVTARAEGLVAAPVSTTTPTAGSKRVEEGSGELGDGPRPEGIPHRRPVDRDPGDAVALVIER
jgi:hypothetical protein